MNNISEHITYEEATVSQTAVRLGIDNTPPAELIMSMQAVAAFCFEPLRAKCGAIHVSSFYRCYALNMAIGGATNSQHIKGQAIDMIGLKVTNDELLAAARELPSWDQIIGEFPNDKGEYAWIHISWVNAGSNRKEVLLAKKVNGVTVYERA